MIRIKQAIVVEGRYDKNQLRQLVDAPVFETAGFGIMNNQKLLAFLRQVAEKRGLVILTDSDGAGFVIRSYLKGTLPRDKVLHAYIPDVYGKEKRKTAPGKEGKLGVEGMRPEILLRALVDAGAEIEGEAARVQSEPVTKADLFALGFSGGRGSAAKRAALLRRLCLPEHMSANALLDALNILYSRTDFYKTFANFEEKP